MKVVEVMFDNFNRTQKLIALGLVDLIRFTNVYSDQEIRAIASENGEDINFDSLNSKRFGRYGIKVKSSSSSPTAKYADFMAMLEIARMYPEQIPPEVVIENSTLVNKEVIAGQIESAERSQKAEVRSQRKQNPSSHEATMRQGKPKIKPSKDFVNVLTTTGKRREDLMV